MAKIKTLMLKGFKSFNRKTVLRFPRGLNLILGANGSGKSNLIDGLCFVLGKTSKKELRAEKLDHLIFKAGNKISKYAKVEVTFDNSDKTFPVETKDVKVSRTILPDGTSLFRISGKRTTLNHVRDLLGFAKIDPSGYNIVLQGDVINFAEMSPVERMDIVKDISGIGVYEDKKDKALGELRKVNEKLKEAGILLSERERYLRELENQKKQAEKHLELQDRLKYKNACYFWKLIENQNKLEQNLIKEIEKEQEKIKIIDNKIEKITENLSKNKLRIKEIRDVEEKKKEVVLAKELESLKANKVSLTESLERDKKDLDNLLQRKEKILLNIERNKKEFDDLQKKFQTNEKVLTDLAKKIQDNELELSAARGFDEKYLKIREELLTLGSVKEKLAKKEILKQELNKLTDDKKKKAEDINKISSSTEDIQKIHEKTLKELDKAESEILKTEREVEEINTKKKIALESLSRGTKEILKLKDKIQGIHGTVGQLAHIPEDFSLSLRVAAGSKINYIVVDNPKVAEECINQLREEKLGIATFVPLDKIKHKEITKTEKMFLKMEGIIGFALSFLKFKKEYENLFKYIFGSTLLVKDLKIARKVGFGNLRMVTLEGDLIETHGIITGGWRREIMGFNIEELDLKLENLNKILPKLNERQIRLVSTKKEIESNLIGLKEKQAEQKSEFLILERRIKELNLEFGLIKENEDLTMVKEKIKELEKNQKKIESLPHKLPKEELQKIEEKHKALAGQRENLIIENNTIDRQINKVLKVEIGDLKNIVPKVEKEYEKLKQEIEGKEKKLNEIISLLKEREKTSIVFTKEHLKLKKELFSTEKGNELFEQKIKNFTENKNKVLLQINKIEIRKAEIISKKEGYSQRYKEFECIEIKEVAESPDMLKEQVEKLKEHLTKLGPVNMLALERYNQIQEEFGKVDDKVKKLISEREDILKMITEIENKKKETFLETFNQISSNFKKTFSKLSPGGDANLLLENPDNIFDGGVDINVKPQGKPVLSVIAASGGEKTITALSLLFAIHEYEPSPFYVFDEVDAALDKENSKIVAELVKKLSKDNQFIVITHNDTTIKYGDRIYGCTMVEGETKLIGLELPKA